VLRDQKSINLGSILFAYGFLGEEDEQFKCHSKIHSANALHSKEWSKPKG
jgi:hypothetical protein